MILHWEETQAFRDYDAWKIEPPAECFVCVQCNEDQGSDDAFTDAPDGEICNDCWNGWKCDDCQREVGRDNLTVVYPDSRAPEFYCAECMETGE